MQWYLKVLRQYADFTGRARRIEYWMFVLFNVIISIVLAIVDIELGSGLLQGLYALAVFLPGVAVGVRRLHDTARSGWWLLIWLIPLVGWIVLIVFLATEGNRGPNVYGSDPQALAPGVAVN